MKRPVYIARKRSTSAMFKRILNHTIFDEKGWKNPKKPKLYSYSCNTTVKRWVPSRTKWRYPWRIWEWHPPQGSLSEPAKVRHRDGGLVYRTKR